MNYSAKSTHLNTTFMLLTRMTGFLLEPAEALAARARPLFRKMLTVCAAALLDVQRGTRSLNDFCPFDVPLKGKCTRQPV